MQTINKPETVWDIINIKYAFWYREEHRSNLLLRWTYISHPSNSRIFRSCKDLKNRALVIRKPFLIISVVDRQSTKDRTGLLFLVCILDNMICTMYMRKCTSLLNSNRIFTQKVVSIQNTKVNGILCGTKGVNDKTLYLLPFIKSSESSAIYS